MKPALHYVCPISTRNKTFHFAAFDDLQVTCTARRVTQAVERLLGGRWLNLHSSHTHYPFGICTDCCLAVVVTFVVRFSYLF